MDACVRPLCFSLLSDTFNSLEVFAVLWMARQTTVVCSCEKCLYIMLGMHYRPTSRPLSPPPSWPRVFVCGINGFSYSFHCCFAWQLIRPCEKLDVSQAIVATTLETIARITFTKCVCCMCVHNNILVFHCFRTWNGGNEEGKNGSIAKRTVYMLCMCECMEQPTRDWVWRRTVADTNNKCSIWSAIRPRRSLFNHIVENE